MVSPLLLPDEALIGRLAEVDAAYTVSRLRMIEQRPGNPLGGSHHRFGHITAFSCRAIPSYSMNRVVGFGPQDADAVEQVVTWFEQDMPAPTIELPPTALSGALTCELRRSGFAQQRVHATVATVLTGPVLAAVGPGDPDVTVERVADQTRMGEFERVHFAGWGLRRPDPEDPDNSIRNWAAEPNWRVYLARYRGTPAGTAILYLSPDIAYLASATTHPEWRGRGVQNALLRHRIADAARAGARIVFGQAEYQSTSYRNMLRTNIPLLYNQSLWTRVE